MQAIPLTPHAAFLFNEGGVTLVDSEDGQDVIFFLTPERQLSSRRGRQYLPKGAVPLAILTIHGERPTVIFLSGTSSNDREPLVNLAELKNFIAQVKESLEGLPGQVSEARAWLSNHSHDRITREKVETMYWAHAVDLRVFIEAKWGKTPEGRLASSLASKHEFEEGFLEEAFPLNDSARSGFYWLQRRTN